MAVCLALAGVLAGAWHLVGRDRVELVDRFGADQLVAVVEAGRDITRDLDDTAATIRFTTQLFQGPGAALADAERQLQVVRAAVREYRLIELYDRAGTRLYSVGDVGKIDELRPVLVETARRAAARPAGSIEASSLPNASGRDWSRVLAVSFSRTPDGPVDGAIAVLYDMHRLYDKLHLLSSSGASRVMLLGQPGEPTAASDPAVARAIQRVEEHEVAAPEFADLLARMRARQHGTLSISEGEARLLGLGDAVVIAAYSQIESADAGRWSIATLASTASLRTHERTVVLRLVGAAAAMALLLVGFGAFLIVASRRAVAVRERLRHADQLSHLHEKGEKVLDNIPTGVISLSDDGRITAVNRVLRDRLPPGAVGAGLAAAFPEAPAAVVSRLESLVQQARTSERVRSLHGERMALFGEEGQYSVHAVPLEARFPDARVLLVIEDLSEVRSLASQLLRAEKLATIGVLSAGIAHEIGTPLGVVRGRAEYIAGKLGPNHPQTPGLQTIVEQIDRVSRTIRQLLDFARVKPAAVRPIPVGPAVRAVLELLRYEAERSKVELHGEVADELPLVMADPDQLQQVLINLTMNAIDACADGGHVRIAAEPGAGPGDAAGAEWRLRLEVVDDGCGIPEEQRVRVFDPFFTTKKRGQGTGLGLTMAAEIVRNHGGEIEVESEVGKGTRMIVLWPTEAVRAAPIGKEAQLG